MKNKINRILFLSLGLFISTYSFAQNEHSHSAPHGGTVKTAGNYHIEMVMSGDKMIFYVLDANEKTLANKGITGNAILQFEDKITSNEKLISEGAEQFTVTVKKKELINCIVTFNINGKSVTAKFPHQHGKQDHHDVKGSHNDGHKH